MAPRFLIDENLSPSLAYHLRSVLGKDAVHVQEVGLRGASDAVVLRYAIDDIRIVMTNNADDFRRLAVRNPGHPGLAFIMDAAGRARQLMLGEALGRAVAAAQMTRGQLFHIDRNGAVRMISWPVVAEVASFH